MIISLVITITINIIITNIIIITRGAYSGGVTAEAASISYM